MNNYFVIQLISGRANGVCTVYTIIKASKQQWLVNMVHINMLYLVGSYLFYDKLKIPPSLRFPTNH